MSSRIRKNQKVNRKLLKRSRLFAILAFTIFLCVIFKFVFFSKSDVILTENFTISQNNGSDIASASVDLEILTDNNGQKYVVMPEKINGVYVEKYHITKRAISPVALNTLQMVKGEKKNYGTSDAIDEENVVNEIIENSINEVSNNLVDANEIENTITNEVENLTNTITNEIDTNSARNTITNMVEETTNTVENEISNTVENTVTNTITNTVTNTVDGETNEVENEVVTNEVIEEDPIENEGSLLMKNFKMLTLAAPAPSNSYDLYPGEKEYLETDENGNVVDTYEYTITADYVKQVLTTNADNLITYKQTISATSGNNTVELTGYMPLGATLRIGNSGDSGNALRNSSDEKDRNATVLQGFSLTVSANGANYEPSDYITLNPTANLSFKYKFSTTGADNYSGADIALVNTYYDGGNLVIEEIPLSSHLNNEIETDISRFGAYGIIRYPTVFGETVYFRDYEDTYNYYIGRNFTDNIYGNIEDAERNRDAGTYNGKEIKKVTLNYYSYNPDSVSDNQYSTMQNFNVNRDWLNNSIYNQDDIMVVNAKFNIDAGSALIDKNKGCYLKFTLGDNLYIIDNNILVTDNPNMGLTPDRVSVVRNGNTTTVEMYVDNLSTHSAWENMGAGNSYYSRTSVTMTIQIRGFNWWEDEGTRRNRINNNLTVNEFKGYKKIPTGYTSNTERYTLYTYEKAVPADSNNNVSIELIDNPFMDRPAGYGFDGWRIRGGIRPSVNTSNWVQTINVDLDDYDKGSGNYEIDLYSNWANAYVTRTNNGAWEPFQGGFSGNIVNGYGNSSPREFNIYVVNSDITLDNNSTNNRTYTSLYNGNLYGSTMNVYGTIDCQNDFQLDYLRVYNNGQYTYTNDGGNNRIRSNSHNLRIGRGMIATDQNGTIFPSVTGGMQGDKKVVVESGKYAYIRERRDDNGSNAGYQITVLGNDMDRLNNNNNNLQVYYQVLPQTTNWGGTAKQDPGSNGKVFDLIVKSGTIGVGYCNSQGTDISSNYIASGIWVGSRCDNNQDNGYRDLYVEGGYIANINGGRGSASFDTGNMNNNINRYNNNEWKKIGIYIIGRNVEVACIGTGSGTTNTIGDRIVQMTGGTVQYNIFGGAISAGQDGQYGQIYGNTLLYIGGNAQIGKEGAKMRNSDSLYNVPYGNVFGSGDGRSDHENNTNDPTGNVLLTTHVILDGSAKVLKNVYAGGNFGTVGPNGAAQENPGSAPLASVSGESAFNSTVVTSIDQSKKYLISSINNLSSSNTGYVLNKNANAVSRASLPNTQLPTNTEEWIFESTGNNKYKIKNASTNEYLKVNPVFNTETHETYNRMQNTNFSCNGNYYFSQGNWWSEFYGYGSTQQNYNYNNNWCNQGPTYVGNANGTFNKAFSDGRQVAHPISFSYVNFALTTNVSEATEFDVNIGNNTISTNISYELYDSQDYNTGVNNCILYKNNAYATPTIERILSYSTSRYWNGNRRTENKTVYLSLSNDNCANTNNEKAYITEYTERDVEKTLPSINEPGMMSTDDPNSPQARVDIIGKNVQIAQNVYGGGNTAAIKGNTFIRITNGTITGSVYGGSNNKGRIYRNVYLKILGGNILNATDGVFGGGYGRNTIVSGHTYITIKDDSADILINGNVYGGSSLGTVNGTSNVLINDISDNNKKITLHSDVYGGGKGETGTACVSNNICNVWVDGGTYPDTRVFGGANVNGTVNDINVMIGNTTPTYVKEVYGGGNLASLTQNNNYYVYVFLNKNAHVGNAFNGGNNAGITSAQYDNRIVSKGAEVINLYGGSNHSGNITKSTIEIKEDSNITNVFGGTYGLDENGNYNASNSASILQNTDIYIYDSKVINTYGGGNAGTVGGNSSIYIKNSETDQVYGSGLGKTATLSGNATIDILDNTTAHYVYGGGDAAALNGQPTINIEASNVVYDGNGAVYGGGKGSTAVVAGKPIITITDGSIVDNVYGGGDAGQVNNSTEINIDGSTVNNNVYGGGNAADITGSTQIAVQGNSQIDNVYGGGNQGAVDGGTDNHTDILIQDSTITSNVYGGGNQGNVDGNANIVILDSSAKNIFGGGQAADVVNTVVNVSYTTTPENALIDNVYGGGDQGMASGNTEVTITNAKIGFEVYGGGNGALTASATSKPGEVEGNTIVTIKDSTAECVFGGGRGVTAEVGGNAEVILEDFETVINPNPGAGKGADYNPAEDPERAIAGDVFGGGNNGPVRGSTKVALTNVNIVGDAFAAGNGATAVTYGNTYIFAEGETTIGKSIFGGGNAAMSGDPSIETPSRDDSHPDEARYVTAIVDIAGAVIGKNVYGGANSSVIQGNTVVNIGNQAIDDFYNSTEGSSFEKGKTTFEQGKIDISGTIFGGGESMDPTKPFNYDTVSVLGTVNITVDGTGYDTDENNTIRFHESIFGSGNASRATGRTKTITIKNYGSTENIKPTTSLQRATDVIVDNSCLLIAGTTDSTSAHPEGYFSFNQIKLLKIKNGTTLYLRSGANLLEAFSSMYDDPTNGEVPAQVNIVDKVTGANGRTYDSINGNIYNGNTIEYYIKNNVIYNYSTDAVVTEVEEISHADTFNLNTDNRIYMYSGVNLNLSNVEDVTAGFGEVVGMTFFGIYKSYGGSDLYQGVYDPDYSIGGTVNWEERDYMRCYVKGLHKRDPEHDIVKDGFYTVFEDYEVPYAINQNATEEDFASHNPYSYIGYITPTPEDAPEYCWYAGPYQEIIPKTITLTASKHSTFGTKELVLDGGIAHSNAKLKLTEFSTNLIEGVGLYNRNEIPSINLDEEAANSMFGLSIKSNNSGWSMVGSTDFYSQPSSSYDGTELYVIENSSVTPTLSFYFYHSNNITEKKELGTCQIIMNLSWQIDDLNDGRATVVIDVIMRTDIYTDIGYNGSISPGTYYELFTNNTTNITTKGSFSTYFGFSQDEFFELEDIQDYYEDSYRVISLDYVLPENTTITMVDSYDNNNPKYYYYNVTSADVAANKKDFKLSEFKVMGSTDEYYNEKEERKNYYIDDLGYENESFIFIVNCENANFTETPDANNTYCLDAHFRLSLKAMVPSEEDPSVEEEATLYRLLDDQIDLMKFGIYESESKIELDADLSKSRIYLGNDVKLNLDTKYDVTTIAGTRIYDTRYFDKKLGVKITFLKEDEDHNWVAVPGSELLGLYFELNGVKYYPRSDGTTRIKIADLVSNASSQIKVGTENSSIDSAKYKIRIESFGSADGIYYGVEASDTEEIELTIINDTYGLDVTLKEEEAIVDTASGHTLDNSVENMGYISETENKLDFTVKYISGLENPYITISLWRRNYDESNPYDNSYTKVNLKNYVEEELEVPVQVIGTYDMDHHGEFIDSLLTLENEYTAFNTDTIKDAVTDNTIEVTLDELTYTLKDSLRTGTYKVMFTLYDATPTDVDHEYQITETVKGRDTIHTVNFEKIGDSFTYVIIK